MNNLFTSARYAAIDAFHAHRPDVSTTNSYVTLRQHHRNDCIAACFRFLSPSCDQEAPAHGLCFSEALLVASNFGLYLSPIIDLDTIKPLNCILLGLTTDPRKHAFLLYMKDEGVHSLYDPGKGILFKGSLVPTYEWSHLALIYKPSPIRAD